MAKQSAIQKNNARRRMAKKYAGKRARLKAIIEKGRKGEATPEEVMEAQFKLQKLPRNSSPNRVVNRCELTGRPRGYHRKFGMSRIALRDLSSIGWIPGVTKSSW